ncbi:helix-turn-helix transcriptional regulator [Sandaracinus amylolyticus]|uniref:Transcriptional regulator, AraC family protein n=1 Tax=Sandaracinus amylolyticus TaxID=927083 RepID=A0A0F6W0T3_9BACT|nr:AraC family transcriptional regulator [Sandaracinus amylolyticus]AKF04530.1 Transcriptional regulator, AraC family protein [Sandaracinus amylolyticus]
MTSARDIVPISARLLERLEALGTPRDRVLAHAGLAATTALSTEQFFAFWRAVEEVSPRRDLGLVVGAEASERGYSVASAAALHAADLAGALHTLARYKRLTCPEVVELEVARGEAHVRFHWVLATSEVPRLLVDSTFASFTSLARRGTAGAVAPLRIELARAAGDAALLRERLGCPVAFGAPVDRITFAERALAARFVTADAEAFSRVVPGLEAELVGRSRTRSLRDEVRLVIARKMSSGARPSVDQVARGMHVSARTLQRRLGEERTSYQEQLDAVRRTSARRLLANTDLDPIDIAFLLGFEEPNSFVRAFRGWERTTPTRWRARVARG